MSSRCVRPPPPCSHLQAYRSGSFNGVEGWKAFRTLHRCVRVRPLGGRAEIRRNLDEVLRCGSCGCAGPRLYACLACAALFCHRHAPAHAESSCPAHEISVDVDRAELFCCACDDQVYDVDFDASIVFAQKRASLSLSSTSSSSLTSALSLALADSLHKRRRVEYRPWSPDAEEETLVRSRSSPMPLSKDTNSQQRFTPLDPASLPWGLRGLNNLGSTCFMNSVLQALLHTPPLRNYFLSDRHNQYRCREQSKCNANKNASTGTNSCQPTRDIANADTINGSRIHFPMSKTVCLVCDLDAIYSDVFSRGDRAPYSPARFLYSWWQHASNLASYEQQDAHEFFISMLDAIHEMAGKDPKKPHVQGNGDCCVAHRIFSGILRSDVTCTICGFTSTTYDPCIDISLGLDSSKIQLKMSTVKSHTGNSMDTVSFYNPTLIGCLEHFTRPERLGSDQKLFCQHCEVRQESLKQMSIRKLPLVTSFHIKRFEHSSSRKISKKVDQFLQFPFSLDLAPYLSSAILRNRFGNRLFAFDVHNSDASAKLASEFELFAVITHTGKLDSGHYVTFLRFSDRWYKCDDAWITHVSENVVRASQAYMLFYVQKTLFYKANEDAFNS